MNQTQFHYKIYHKESVNVACIISDIDSVVKVKELVSIDTGEKWDNNVICTTVNIEICNGDKFKKLDDKLNDKFIDIWFDF